MNVNLWKWILEHMDDRRLMALVNRGDLTIPGFRRVTPKTIGKAKKKIVAEAVKGANREKLIERFRQVTAKDRDGLRGEELSIIKKRLEEGRLEPVMTMAALAAGEDAETRERAQRLFHEITPLKLSQWARRFAEAGASREQVQKHKGEKVVDPNAFQRLQKMWEKSEAKNLELKQRLEETEKDYLQLKRENAEKVKALKQEMIRLEQTVGRLHHEVAKLLEENERLKAANDERMRRTADKKEEWERQQEVAAAKDALESADIRSQRTVRRIAMIGNPKNPSIEQTAGFDIEMIEPAELEKALAEKRFDDVDEVWLLTYRTPLVYQRMVKRRVKADRLVSFNHFIALKKHMKKGLSDE